MAFHIEIAKVREKNGIGYYEVSTKHFGGAHFYIGIDKAMKKLYIYESMEPLKLLREIDCKERERRIDSFENISMHIIARVVMRAMKSFDMAEFPKYLSYVA